MTASASSNITTGDQKPSTVDVLKKARALIEKPKNWTQHEYARNKLGENVLSLSPAATCWCALGAIIKFSDGAHVISHAERALERVIAGRLSVSSFNDSHSHAEVLAAFDRAIELAASTEPGSPVAIEPSNAEGVVSQ